MGVRYVYVKWWALLVLVVVFYIPYIKRVVYFPYLFFHEFGHSFMAFILRVHREKMRFNLHDGSGDVIIHYQKGSKVKLFLIGVIGYIFPVLVVYGGVWTIQNEMTGIFFIALMVMIVYGVINTRSIVGWVIISAGAYVGGKMLYEGSLSVDATHALTYYLVWLIGVGCFVTITRLIRTYIQMEPEENGDAYLLSREFYLPVIVWVVFFVMVNMHAVYKLIGLILGKW